MWNDNRFRTFVHMYGMRLHHCIFVRPITSSYVRPNSVNTSSLGDQLALAKYFCSHRRPFSKTVVFQQLNGLIGSSATDNDHQQNKSRTWEAADQWERMLSR